MKIRIYPQSLLETVWQQDKLLFTPEAAQPPLCLRCGQPLDRRLVINALSRYADVHICEACGMDEALRDANRCPLPLTEWAAVKNGLSQQRTDFEDPLLTTSCTFEYSHISFFLFSAYPKRQSASFLLLLSAWEMPSGLVFSSQFTVLLVKSTPYHTSGINVIPSTRPTATCTIASESGASFAKARMSPSLPVATGSFPRTTA